jgi:hypothetical protein
MAAEQDSAAANYALGAIYNNRWLRSHRDEDARLAQSYFQRALRLGEKRARAALDKLAEYRKTQRNAVSLSYTNADFAAGSAPKPAGPPNKAAQRSSPGTSSGDTLAGFAASGDPAADAEKLKDLLNRLRDGAQPADLADVGAFDGLLGGFESIDQLISDIARLLENVEEAGKIDTAPGSN